MSSSRTHSVGGVLSRFPQHWNRIVERCRQDDDFRELCEHFGECQFALRKLQGQPIPDAQRLREYGALTEELEQEIVRMLGTEED